MKYISLILKNKLIILIIMEFIMEKKHPLQVKSILALFVFISTITLFSQSQRVAESKYLNNTELYGDCIIQSVKNNVEGETVKLQMEMDF